MIVYFDNSAVVPILIDEPTTQLCRQLWTEADRRVTARLTFVETAAALAMAERQHRITTPQQDAAWSNFVAIWADADVIELTTELTAVAAHLASSLALRAYDAVQCAAALSVDDQQTVAATGDLQLLTAWRSLGLAVVDTHRLP